jgi:hypothetical protein
MTPFTDPRQECFDFLDFEDGSTLRGLMTAPIRRRGRRSGSRLALRQPELFSLLVREVPALAEDVNPADVFTDSFGLPRWVGRRLASASAADLQFVQEDYALRRVANWLAAVGPDRAPENGGLANFCACMARLEELAPLLGRPVTALLPSVGMSWDDLWNAIDGNGAACVRSFLEGFFSDVFLPEVFFAARSLGLSSEPILGEIARKRQAAEYGVFGNALFAGKQVQTVVAGVRDIVFGGGGHPLSLPGGKDVGAILQLLPEWSPVIKSVEIDGLVVVPLTTTAAMTDEGLALRHCLGRYAWRCAFVRNVAFSIRTQGGYRLASAVLAYDRNLKFSILDQAGFANDGFDRRARNAISNLMRLLNESSQETHDFECARKARVREYGADRPETDALYPFTFAPLREWKFRSKYALVLPPSEARLCRDAWLEAKGLKKLASEWARRCAGSPSAQAA